MNKLIRLCVVPIFLFIVAPSVMAAAQCGGYHFTIGDDGMGVINGDKTTSQKVTFLKNEGDWDQIKLDMSIMPASDGNMYGFEFIKRNGKDFLNVELLRANMDAPRIIGTFDCKKIPD